MTMTVRRPSMRRWTLALAIVLPVLSHAQSDAGGFAFAVVGSGGEHGAEALLRAVDGSTARFVIHFDLDLRHH